MLILQRKAGESLLIGGDIEVSVLSVDAGRVRLAIQAPKSVPILAPGNPGPQKRADFAQ